MANVVNTKATRVASKDAISGGKKFPLGSQDSIDSGWTPGTGSEEARNIIMKMRVRSTGLSSNVETGLKQNKALK